MSQRNKAVVRRFYRMSDGLIAEEWADFDALGLMRQIGLVAPAVR